MVDVNHFGALGDGVVRPASENANYTVVLDNPSTYGFALTGTNQLTLLERGRLLLISSGAGFVAGIVGQTVRG